MLSDKRDEWKDREKEEVMKSFYEIQTKKLKIEEINTHVRSKEVDNKQTELKLALLTEETKIMTTP
jgi:hypothetical protein